MNIGSIKVGTMVAGEILLPWPDPTPGRQVRAPWSLERSRRAAARIAKVAAIVSVGVLVVPLACAGGAVLAVLMLPAGALALPVLIMSRRAEPR